MTFAQRIGQAAASAETATRAGEFAALAKFIMASGGCRQRHAQRRLPRATETWDRALLEF